MNQEEAGKGTRKVGVRRGGRENEKRKEGPQEGNTIK